MSSPIFTPELPSDPVFPTTKFTPVSPGSRPGPLRPGPHPLEALGWTVGVIVVHVIAGLITAIGIMIWIVASTGDAGLLRDQKQLQGLIEEQIAIVTSGEQFLFVLVVLMAVGLRLSFPPGPAGQPALARLKNRLGSAGLGLRHLAVTVVMVLPVSLACGQLYMVADKVWKAVLRVLPGLPDIDSIQTTDLLEKLATDLSTPGLIFVLAVLPAVGEELVFRGVIGRGLVARLGVVPGILITSFLFAIVHVHPAHALAVFPLGIALHVLYLATRSIWAPILLHFLNNAWAAVVTKYAEPMKLEQIRDDVLVPWPVLLTAVFCGICVVVYLWKSRIEYRLANGESWRPLYRSVESPAVTAIKERCRPPLFLTLALLVSVAGFYTAAALFAPDSVE